MQADYYFFQYPVIFFDYQTQLMHSVSQHLPVFLCFPDYNLLISIEAWQHLINTGLAWNLQGWFGRQATTLIEAGICHKKGDN